MNKRSQGISRGIVIILMLIAFVAGAGVGIGGFIYVTGGDGTPSRDVSEVIAETDTQTNDPTADTSSTNDSVDTAQSAGDSIVFSIDGDQSQASFTIHEELRNVPTTVIGTTSEVGGTIHVNFDNPSASTISTIAVNARTLATDSDMRNRTIRSRILESAQDQYEFAEFTPTAIVGLPASVAIGDTVTFQITGDLNLHGVTNSVTFDATVTIVSPDRIEGLASATVLYADYNISVPRVPQVSNVDDDVILEIEFVALAVTE